MYFYLLSKYVVIYAPVLFYCDKYMHCAQTLPFGPWPTSVGEFKVYDNSPLEHFVPRVGLLTHMEASPLTRQPPPEVFTPKIVELYTTLFKVTSTGLRDARCPTC